MVFYRGASPAMGVVQEESFTTEYTEEKVIFISKLRG
jgi:hypothetical protein